MDCFNNLRNSQNNKTENSQVLYLRIFSQTVDKTLLANKLEAFFLIVFVKSVYFTNNKYFENPDKPFRAFIFASFFRFMQANVSPTFISIRAFPIICV